MPGPIIPDLNHVRSKRYSVGDMDLVFFKTLFSNLTVQRLLLAVAVVLTFLNGLWGGVPRADQLYYLHQISQYADLSDIVAKSSSWNRTEISGDIILFRPVLFLQLGLFYHFFKYDFFLWQLASLLLHILVVFGVHSIFIQGELRKTVYPFLWSALFGCGFIGSELVLWQHISGYITFSLFAVYMVSCLMKFATSGNKVYGYSALPLGILAEFTYELGAVLNLMVCGVFFMIGRSEALPGKKVQKRTYLKLSFLFFGCAMLYPLWSYADLVYREIQLPTGAIHSKPQALLLTAGYALGEIVFWLGGWIFPASYNIHAMTRASFAGLRFSGIYFLLNCCIVVGFCYLFTRTPDKKAIFDQVKNRQGFRLFLCALLFLLLYAFVVAYGRVLPRGVRVLGTNVYYAYQACLAVVCGIGLLNFATPKTKLVPRESAVMPAEAFVHPAAAKRSLLNKCLLVALVVLNSHSTFNLASAFRYDYSPARFEVLDAVKQWIAGNGHAEQAFFSVNESCVGNDKLPWFSQRYFRKNIGWFGPVTMADVLWPEKSLQFNRQSAAGMPYETFEIRCPQVTASSQFGEYGAAGLLAANDPGWHAGLPLAFPQTLEIDFIRNRKVANVHFLPQDGEANRMPRNIAVDAADDRENWQEVYSGALACSGDSQSWREMHLAEAVDTRYLRIRILSNCGNPVFLTLRGLRFD